MFSYIKKVASYVLHWGSDSPMGNMDEDEGTILNNIKKINFQDEGILESIPRQEQPFGESETVHYEVETFKFVHKTGKVTHLCKDYGLIDNVVYFDIWRVSSNLALKVGDEVLYSSYRAKENETDRVYKVYALKNDFFEFENNSALESQATESEKTENLSALPRVITGRVTKRRGREVYIESAELWCNLDNIKATYIPVEGDWVELQAVVTLDEEADNLSGDVLEVRSLKPLLVKDGCGRVTFWSESKREGAIENSIYFTHVACDNGFLPGLGDRVTYLAVESDQERFTWRALKVLKDRASESERHSVVQNEGSICKAFTAEGMCEVQNGIRIDPVLCTIDVSLEELKTFELDVTNVGEARQFLKHAALSNSGKASHVRLVSPRITGMDLLPGQTVTFQFECEGKFLGLFGEIFSLHFTDFAVTRRIEIKVRGTEEMNKFLPCFFDPSVIVVGKKKKGVRDEEEADFIFYGPRPWKPPKFLCKERKYAFKIPKALSVLVHNGSNQGKIEKGLLKYAPCLRKPLNYDEYAVRFHTLLFLEEIEVKGNFHNYDMNKVCLNRSDEYFKLEVPDLVEKRPSLIVGDKVVLEQPWTEGDRVKHVGYVHEIRNKEVFIKFHGIFHDTYDESACNVYFEPQLSFFSKAHNAVHRAGRVLGEQWLFPETVSEKSPQVDFLVAEVEKKLPKETLKSQDSVESPLNGQLQKTLHWVNKNLNERQRLAVVSALKGQGRPLPYIIFGPPGTGKTVTLVEIVIQLYRLMPESRILITTPSNSAADLITERLIDIGQFKPGQLMRLVALYRVHENLVPPKLRPYTTFHNGRDIPRRTAKNHIQGSSASEIAGRSRITVSTCSAISFLHYVGLPPGHFSHILVDEAGQTSEPEVLISATFLCVRTGQLILTGDPQQLGPIFCNHLAKKFGLGISLMQRLSERFPYTRDLTGFPGTSGYDPRFIVKLNVNYRTVPEILSLPSQMFYNADLIATISQTEGREAEIIEAFNFQNEKRKTPAAIIFQGIVGQNHKDPDSPSWFNAHEVWQVVFYIKKLYSTGLKSSDIGVVTPYSKQAQKLRNLLLKLNLSAPKVGSVEEFQGQERNVIIVSTVRSSAKHVASDIRHSLGFVASPQRLNVALTRARALLIIVGNPILLSKDPYWLNVVQYCVKNNSYTGYDTSLEQSNGTAPTDG